MIRNIKLKSDLKAKLIAGKRHGGDNEEGGEGMQEAGGGCPAHPDCPHQGQGGRAGPAIQGPQGDVQVSYSISRHCQYISFSKSLYTIVHDCV